MIWGNHPPPQQQELEFERRGVPPADTAAVSGGGGGPPPETLWDNAGCAGVLLEDQENPKRCGHTRGKRVVDWPEAEARLRAAVDARDEMRAAGVGDLFIIARTDARATHSLDEAIHRCQRFMELGADMTFMEAPRDVAEMRKYCSEVPGPKLANMLEGGLT